MTILQAIILSIVEGITEFLPISSTGHMVLASVLMGIPQTEFLKSFEIAIQVGAILAVVGLYAKTKLFKKAVFTRLVVAFIPTAVIGLIFYKLVKGYLLGNLAVTLWALLIGGVALIIVEQYLGNRKAAEKEIEQMSLKQAAIIGVCQSLAIVPGVSRAAATIIGARLLGLSRVAAVEFSFLLAVPTMLAATGLDVIKSGWHFTSHEWLLLGIGFVAAYVSAFFAVKYFVKFVQTHDFTGFGLYRIFIAVVFLFGV